MLYSRSIFIILFISGYLTNSCVPKSDHEWAITPKYDETRDFKNGRAKVKLDEKWGVIDKNGDEIIPIIYDDINPYYSNTGNLIVEINNKYGLIDSVGQEILPIQFDKFSAQKEVNGGFYHFTSGNQDFNYVIDSLTNTLTPVKYSKVSLTSAQGLFIAENNQKMGIIDHTGKEIIPLAYDSIGYFSKEKLSMY